MSRCSLALSRFLLSVDSHAINFPHNSTLYHDQCTSELKRLNLAIPAALETGPTVERWLQVSQRRQRLVAEARAATAAGGGLVIASGESSIPSMRDVDQGVDVLATMDEPIQRWGSMESTRFDRSCGQSDIHSIEATTISLTSESLSRDSGRRNHETSRLSVLPRSSVRAFMQSFTMLVELIQNLLSLLKNLIDSVGSRRIAANAGSEKAVCLPRCSIGRDECVSPTPHPHPVAHRIVLDAGLQ